MPVKGWDEFKEELSRTDLNKAEQEAFLKLVSPARTFLEEVREHKTNLKLAGMFDPSGELVKLIEDHDNLPLRKVDGTLVRGTDLAARMKVMGEAVEKMGDSLAGDDIEEVVNARDQLFAIFEELCDFFGIPKVESEEDPPLC